jgi:broad specificity phosphatase PhoE
VRLLLIRHGESEWNAVGRWQGQADPPLSPRGRNQALTAAKRLVTLLGHPSRPVRGIASSTLTRAIDTATVISDELRVRPLYLEHDLIERDAGEWSGLTRDEIDLQFPGYLASGKRPPLYESDEDVLSRTLGAVARVVEQFRPGASEGDTVIVVTHGGIIYSIENHLGAPFQRKPNLGARFVLVGRSGLRLGDTVDLLDPSSTTTPDLL